MHVIKLDNWGSVIWDTPFGIINGGAESVIQTRDGGYAILMTNDK